MGLQSYWAAPKLSSAANRILIGGQRYPLCRTSSIAALNNVQWYMPGIVLEVVSPRGTKHNRPKLVRMVKETAPIHY